MLRRWASMVRGAEEELLGDLAVRVSPGDELCDLALAGRQGIAAGSPGRALDPVPKPPQLPHRLVPPALCPEAGEDGLRLRILPTSAGRAASSTALILSHGVPVR